MKIKSDVSKLKHIINLKIDHFITCILYNIAVLLIMTLNI